MSQPQSKRYSDTSYQPVRDCQLCSNTDAKDSYLENNHCHTDHEPSDHHDNDFSEEAVVEEGDQLVSVDQESDELIWIKDSCNVTVQTTDTQASVSLQIGLQLAIALVVSIAIGDSNQGQAIAQDIFQRFNDEQSNKQKIIIYNSKDVNIVTTDTDLAVNIQAMLQVLVSLVVKLDVL
ncbi:spore coat protein [Psychrobacillus sp. MER TA 171]|uniref:spore coat protein n=1 Tax=Psychrobacillus sp. MER TA 171 TaxID=2939577 RepID=UPI00203F508D|nr:spore coat protein [Psychrobacillus sp. MER TA 171]MCM3359979.1 spore coat protein [Psychrobacillus sp. MER TA 171]